MNYLLITIFLFSTYEVVAKPILSSIDSFQLNFIRFFLGGVTLLVIASIRGTLRITRKEFVELAFLGILNVGIVMNLLQLSLAVPGAQASVTALVFSSNPIFVYLSSIVFGKEKIEPKRFLITLLSLLGTIILFLPSLKNGIDWNLSLLLALAASLLYGLFTFLAREASLRMSSLKMNGYTFLLGSLSILPILAFRGTPIFHVPRSILPQVAYLTIFVSGIAYFSYFLGLERLGASKGSLVFFFKPVIAGVLAALFLKEPLTLHFIIGTVLIMGGVFSVFYGRDRVPLVKEP